MPRLSILLPTYNGARFLPQQLDSILAQDDEDFALVSVDDGSSDGTREVIADYAARDRRIRVVASQGNLGQANRIAQLVGEARSDLIAIADQDDVWSPDRNSRLIAGMGNRSIALGTSELIDGDGKRLGKTLQEAIIVGSRADGRLNSLIQPSFPAHSMMVERSAMSPAVFYSPLPFDWLMGTEAHFLRGLAIVPEAVVFHRIHGGNQLSSLAVGSVSVVHRLLLFRRIARMHTWLILDFLSRSLVIDADLRRKIGKVAQRCFTVWMTDYGALRNDGGLNALLKETFAPYATDDADLAEFFIRVDAVTSPIASRAVLSEAWRRYRR